MRPSNLWLKFFEAHPLLFFGLNLLFATLVISEALFVFLIPWILLYLPFKRDVLKPLCVLPVVLGICFLIPSDEKVHSDPCLFEVHSIDTVESRVSTYFYVYRGKVDGYDVTTMSPSSKLFTPGFTYRVYGDLTLTEFGNYQLKLNKSYKARELKKSSYIHHVRYEAQKKFKSWIESKYDSKGSSAFIYGIATGKFSDRLLKFLFSKYQLVHLLVISGFHLSLLCLFIFKTTQVLLGKRSAIIISLILLGGYVLFLGFSPSLFRAYVSSSIFLIGLLMGRQSISLNSLGCALAISLLIDPKLVLSLGFQFSFLVTGSILFFYPWIRSKFKPKSRLSKYLVNLLSISIAVQLVSVPISLFYFHKTSLIGLFLNLWVPLLFTLFLYLLVISLALSFLPFLGKILLYLTELVSKLSENLVYLPWEHFDYPLRFSYLSFEFVMLWLTGLFFLGMLYHSRHKGRLQIPI